MDRNKRYFLDFLCGTPSKNVLFEPFIDRTLTEALIWRRGVHLWGTPWECIDTLASATERTKSDMLYLDLRGFSLEEKEAFASELAAFRKRDDKLGIGVICDDETGARIAEEVADCLCLYGEVTSRKLPVVRMDGSVTAAVARGDCGWFAADGAEKYLSEFGDRIKILGGLGADFITSSKPVTIYSTVERIAAEYPGRWACGSGGRVPGDKYLEFISLLGAFARIRHWNK